MAVPLTLDKVPEQTPYIQYVATNGQTVFPYPFVITQDSDLIVVANGVTLATDSGYTLSGQGNDTGGNVTFTSGRATGDIITLFRDIAIERLTQFGQNSGFSSTAFNAEFNNVYLILQQLEASIGQCLQVPNTNNPAPTTILAPGSYANKYLAFDGNGNPTPAVLTSSGSLTGSILAGILNTYTAQAVLPPNVRTGAEIAAAVTPVNYAYSAQPINILRYGADPTQTNDCTAAINAAIAVALQTNSSAIYIPAGKYLTSGQIIWKNGLHVYGDGNTKSVLVSTYTGGDQNVILNPINSSTVANVTFEDIQFQSGATNAGKGNFADTGSSYLYFTRVAFSGNGINLILDQSEIVRVRDCLFDNIEVNSLGIWIVNGAEHTVGANGLFTNDILVTGCQFVGPSTATLIADDGGHSHKFIGNNFDGGSSQIRVNQCSTLLVEANEMEDGIVAVDFQVTKVGGNTGATSDCATITQNLFSVAGNDVLRIGGLSSSLQTLEFTENAINSTSSVINSIQNVGKDVVAYGNVQIGSGDNYFLINNYWSLNAGASWTPAWSSQSGTPPTLGNGSFTVTYDRRGKQVLIRLTQNMGSTTTFTGTTWTWTLPVTAATEALNYLGVARSLVAGATLTMGVANISSGGTTFSVSPNSGTANWGSGVPGVWASGDTLSVQLEYKAANWLG